MKMVLLVIVCLVSGCMVHRDAAGRVVGVSLDPRYGGPAPAAAGTLEGTPTNQRAPQNPRKGSGATTASRGGNTKAKVSQRPGAPSTSGRESDAPIVVGRKKPSEQSADELAASIGGDPSVTKPNVPAEVHHEVESGSKLETIPVNTEPPQPKKSDLPAW